MHNLSTFSDTDAVIDRVELWQQSETEHSLDTDGGDEDASLQKGSAKGRAMTAPNQQIHPATSRRPNTTKSIQWFVILILYNTLENKYVKFAVIQN